MNIDLSSTIKFKCLCYDGYDGQYCNETKDFCSKNPCKNGGSCSVIEEADFASYMCTCVTGFTGVHCEDNVNECEEHPCGYGNCIDLIGNYKCECYPGYKGRRCSEKIHHCNDTENVCNKGNCNDTKNVCNEGNCTLTEKEYECQCPPEYIGFHCNILDECHPNKCNHQGICEPSHNEHELLFVYSCTCNDGFSGSDCTKEVARGGDDTNLIVIILIPVMSLFILCLLIGAVIFLRMAKKKRATRGTYSPSRQEMFGSRVEMNHVMKPPPEERLI